MRIQSLSKSLEKLPLLNLKSLNLKGVMPTLSILFLYLLLSKDLVLMCSFELASGGQIHQQKNRTCADFTQRVD